MKNLFRNIGIMSLALLAVNVASQENTTAPIMNAPSTTPGNVRLAGMRLEWTYFIGSSQDDNLGWLRAPVLDRNGMLWFTGTTMSSDFPTTPDALDRVYRGGSDQWGKEDVYLLKFNTRQPGIAYSTLLGGAKGPEHASELIVNENGTITLVGNTGSSDYPATSDALTKQFQGPDFRHADGFLTILGDGGRMMKYSTFIGGSKNDWVDKVFIDASGEMTLFGITESPGFPSTDTVRPKEITEASALFVLRLDAKGQQILSSRVLANTWGTDVQRLDSGDFLIVGSTSNPAFQTTPGAFSSAYRGGSDTVVGGDLFIMRLSADLKTIVFATLFGGSGDELWPKIAAVADGDFFIVGQTTSKDLPVTANAVEKTMESKKALFIARFSEDSRQLKYCSYLGGKGTGKSSHAGPLVYDGRSRIYLTGTTTSSNYPVTPDAMQTKHRGKYDAILFAFNVSDNSLAYGSYLGGSQDDWYPFLAFDTGGSLYMIGSTKSNDFPSLENPPSQRKKEDIYISKFTISSDSAQK